MSTLPNAHSAIIDRRKLEYCLDSNHPTGRHKARVFRSAMGLRRGDEGELERILREIVNQRPARLRGITPLGDELWVVESEVRGERGPMLLVSAWAIDRQVGVPRLVSCHLKGMKR